MITRHVSRRALTIAVVCAAVGLASLGMIASQSDVFVASGPVVVLDPGHGADELGAVGNGVVERDSNLDMAKRVQAILEADGVRVVLTRTTDGRADGLRTDGMDLLTATFADLQARVARSNQAHASVFVSLHSNSFDDPSVSGIDVWYDSQRSFSDQNRALATLLSTNVAEELSAAGFPTPTSEPRDELGSMDAAGRTTPYFVLGGTRVVTRSELADRGVSAGALDMPASWVAYRTNETNAPGALLELLYISNEGDAAMLRDPDARAAMARGIAEAILTSLGRSPA